MHDIESKTLLLSCLRPLSVLMARLLLIIELATTLSWHSSKKLPKDEVKFIEMILAFKISSLLVIFSLAICLISHDFLF